MPKLTDDSTKKRNDSQVSQASFYISNSETVCRQRFSGVPRISWEFRLRTVSIFKIGHADEPARPKSAVTSSIADKQAHSTVKPIMAAHRLFFKTRFHKKL